jgi:hypothetical protein
MGTDFSVSNKERISKFESSIFSPEHPEFSDI